MTKKKPEQIINKLLDEIEIIRKTQKLSHEKLAELAGIHRSTISLILNKKRIPTILTCLKITQALNVNLANILNKLD